MPSKRYLAVRGSRREPMPQATKIGPCNPKERLRVTILLRQRVAQTSGFEVRGSSRK